MSFATFQTATIFLSGKVKTKDQEILAIGVYGWDVGCVMPYYSVTIGSGKIKIHVVHKHSKASGLEQLFS